VLFCAAVFIAFVIATPFLKKMAALDRVEVEDLTREDEPGAFDAEPEDRR
jgi:hypothetical protein